MFKLYSILMQLSSELGIIYVIMPIISWCYYGIFRVTFNEENKKITCR